ncbi:hypothetical protein [Streptomyces niveus]|uniref:hypothetical protein n=1 Tax=Streptomyces niveus TaxID=193462 RepID=UPI0037BA21CB
MAAVSSVMITTSSGGKGDGDPGGACAATGSGTPNTGSSRAGPRSSRSSGSRDNGSR